MPLRLIMKRSTLYIAVVSVLCSAMMILTPSLAAQVVKEKVSELESVDVEEHLGEYIPLDLTFTDDNGKIVTMENYLHQGKPVILVMGYYECPMLCNLVFNGLVNTMREMDWHPGEEFLVVTVSINPNEDHVLAKAKKANYLSALDIPSAETGWSFLTGDSVKSRKLANAIGFKYYYDENIQQYAHPALLTLLADDGKISRYLYGIEFKQNDLKFALMEAADGKIGNSLDKLILYCYHYDPDSKGYVVFAGNVMRLGGGITLVLLGLLVGTLLYRERRKRRKKQMTASVVH